MKHFWMILFSVLVLVVCIGGIVTFIDSRISDDVQIKNMLEAARLAAEQRDTIQVLQYVSAGYHDDNGNDYPEIRLLIIQTLRNFRNIKIAMRIKNMQIEGKEAKVDLSVTASAVDENLHVGKYNGPFSIGLKKEKGHQFWIFPIEKWHIISSNGLPSF